MNEIVTALSTGSIDFDFEGKKQYLETRLEDFRTAVFTDKTIKEAKSYLAEIRKEQKALKDGIGEVKKAYMAPFEEFKAKADELVRLYDEPIGFINGQVQDYETNRKEAKRNEIKGLYEEAFSELAEIVPLEKVYDARWENATYKMADVKSELGEKANRIISDINIIRNNPSSYAGKAEEIYINSLDLNMALARIQEYEAARREEIEREREAETQRRIDEALRIEREKAEIEQRTREEVIDEYIPDHVDGEEARAYLYSINLTKQEKKALEMYMDSIGLEWGEV